MRTASGFRGCVRAAVVLALTLPALPSTGAELRQETMEFEGQPRSYALYVPDRAAAAAPMPLLVALHGSHGRGRYMVRQWQSLADAQGVIVVGPDASDPAGWRTPEDCPEFLYALTRLLREHYPVDARRLYLFGYSAGGKIALTLSMLESEYYAATAVFGAVWQAPEETRVMALARRKLPFKIIAGQQDPSAPDAGVRYTRQVLNRAGFPHEVTLVPRHGHRYDDIAGRINTWAWEFLREQRLEGEPRHVRYPRPASPAPPNP